MGCAIHVEVCPQNAEVIVDPPTAIPEIGTQARIEYFERSTYVHDQAVPSDTWTIVHNMKTWPSVTIVDSAGTRVFGSVQYVDENTIICTFNGAFSGRAFLN